MNVIERLGRAEFMNEPAYRWLVFGVGVMCFGIAWKSVVDFMKE